MLSYFREFILVLHSLIHRDLRWLLYKIKYILFWDLLLTVLYFYISPVFVLIWIYFRKIDTNESSQLYLQLTLPQSKWLNWFLWIFSKQFQNILHSALSHPTLKLENEEMPVNDASLLPITIHLLHIHTIMCNRWSVLALHVIYVKLYTPLFSATKNVFNIISQAGEA